MARMDPTLDSSSNPGFGNPSYVVDGESVAVNAIALYNAVMDGAPHYLEVRSADLSERTQMRVGQYTEGVLHCFGLYLSDTEATPESRAAAHAYVQARLALRGVTLPDLP